MISINRDNYETWLMLYLDNELTASERAMVEAFAGMHPDVQEELDGLKETILQPETPVAMPGVERLLMPELWNEAALTPMQEKLLLLADNELVENEKDSLLTTIANNAQLGKEWALLQKAITVEPTLVEMPGKENLYRQSTTRVIPMGRVWRIAAAAAILGFGWFFLAKQNTEISDGDVPQLVEATTPKPSKAASSNNTVEIEDKSAQNTQNVGGEIAIKQRVENKIPIKKNQDEIVKEIPGVKEHNLPKEVIARQDTKDLPSNTEKNIAQVLTSVKFVDVPALESNEIPAISNPVKVEIAATPDKEPLINTSQILRADEIEEDATINIAGARISKQKVRNLYRNVTRPIARTIERNNIFRSDDTGK